MAGIVAVAAEIPFFNLAVAQDSQSTTSSPETTAPTDNTATAPVPLVPMITQTPAPAAAAPPGFGGPLWERQKLTGDWFGTRSDLRDAGYTFDLSSTQYYQGVAAGGLQQSFQYGGRLDYLVNVDGEKAGLWKGAFVNLHAETRYGDSVNSQTGTLLPPNLMLSLPQATGSVTALTGVKFTQALSENLIVYGGKLNMFDGFKQQITGASGTEGFLNMSLMFNPVYARTIPYSTFGTGFAYLQNLEPIFTTVVVDTNNTPTVSGFNTFLNNGVTILSMLNVPTQLFEMPGHQGISGTYSTGTYSPVQPTAYFDPNTGNFIIPTANVSGSWSLAYGFDQALYVSPTNSRKYWGVFGNLGLADQSTSPINWFGSVGLSGVSPFESRPMDTFGIGYSYTGVSDRVKQTLSPFVPLQNEEVVELFYNIAITQWFRLTPDIQIIDPLLSRVVDTSLVVGMRAKIDF